MSTQARLDGTTVDLSALTPSDIARIAELHGNIDRGDEMYLRKQGDRYYAVHFPGAQCTAEHTMTPETDEHRRQKDY